MGPASEAEHGAKLDSVNGASSPDRMKTLLRIGIAAAALCLASWLVKQALGAGLVDDSYIFLRYAENFALGNGPVFNPGERVEGYSSPLWLVLLTIVRVCGADPVAAAGALSGILGLSLPVIILVALGKKQIDQFIAALVAAVFLATHASNAFWSWTGMDSALFAALSLLTLVLVLHPSRPTLRSAVFAGLAFSSSALARPEALAFLPIYLFYLIATDPGPPRRRLRIPAGFLAPMFLVAGSFVIRRIYYGAWLPNTYYAKADVDRMVLVADGAEYLLSFLAANILPIILFAALLTLALVRCETPRAPWLLVAALILTAMATTVSLGGDHFPLHRFLLPTLVFVAFGLARGLSELTQWFPSLAGFRGAVLAAVVLALLGVSNSRLILQSVGDTRAQVTMAERWSEVGRWFHDNAAPDATMASIVVGAIPYYSGLDCIDLLGLTDATVSREGAVYAEGAVGHQRYHTDYVLSRQPTYIIFNQSGLYDEPSHEIGLRHAYALWDILQDPRTSMLYDLRTVTTGDANVILFLELMDQGS